MIVLTIAANTFKEIIRDRILIGIGVFALLLFGLSIALGELSYAENARITIDFGFTGIHLSCVILSLFVGSQLVWKELEKQTILTVLARSVTRFQFILGKFLGMSFVLVILEFGLLLVLGLVLGFVGRSPDLIFFQAGFGVLLESLVLLSFTVLFGVLTAPLLSMMFVIGIFLIGHWMDSMHYFAEKSDAFFFKAFEMVLKVILPNLERFNWRDLVAYGDLVPWSEMAWSTIHAGLWLVIVLSLTGFLFERKDFV